jgi:2-succinyl-5-enolpyruvyl-6-hydroxy-3-cyclohexene-1-carboxylate synthase
VQQDEARRHAAIIFSTRASHLETHRTSRPHEFHLNSPIVHTEQISVSAPTDTYLLLAAFVDELARCGLRDACTSPGSRCTPLVLSLARDERLRCHSHIDERCSGFFALGLAKSSGLPVAVTCTSGTAVAELLPAVIEAREARVPLLVLSADRPPELRESGAGQTIDQLGIFGGAAKWFFEVGTHELDLRAPGASAGGAGEPRPGDRGLDEGATARLRWMRTLACRAYWRTLEGRPGVVHLNFALREPLVTDGRPLPPDGTGRRASAPYVSRPPARLHELGGEAELRSLLAGARRGVLVAGRHESRGIAAGEDGAATVDGGRPSDVLGEAAAAFCSAAGWPLLADPLSGARRGNAAIAHYDALLRDPVFASGQRPDFVLRVGDLPTSKPLREWLAGLGDTPQVALDPEGAWQDPASVLTHSFALEPARALADLLAHATREAAAVADGDRDWLQTWRSADELAAEAILGVLAAGGLSEPALAAELGVLLPAEATLFVASSMPVRDIETFWPVRPDPPRVLCNRGANGIDGTVSSAFGAAAAARGPVVLLIGDVAFAHDVGGLLAARRLELPLTIVLVDNGGGGIFDFLPVAAAPLARVPQGGDVREGDLAPAPRGVMARVAQDASRAEDVYTHHIATPTGLDFARAAELYGLRHERVADVTAFRAALERTLTARPRGAEIIEARGERAVNVELHRRVYDAVAGVLGDANH